MTPDNAEHENNGSWTCKPPGRTLGSSLPLPPWNESADQRKWPGSREIMAMQSEQGVVLSSTWQGQHPHSDISAVSRRQQGFCVRVKFSSQAQNPKAGTRSAIKTTIATVNPDPVMWRNIIVRLTCLDGMSTRPPRGSLI